ncbi:RecQ family ATP-dependent DNA helicase [Frondihabitans sp. VKM Ac-2883]|uniref:RecQ family ATP-dependent DNA helicase n=1 Tax=Frondihabitans sp. VKM Ac-2883 TaxID=2783823 RepID=UPI00188D66B8|nr:RecQ family ATP-dependent DNA helicase [Frondihabitans sp. VKM Ac-2883]MBF4576997.1 RecQ family ATP-dependent DNA helicase [Frondihabitans sp. VKM Ac-2883]
MSTARTRRSTPTHSDTRTTTDTDTKRITRAAADLFGWDDLHPAQLEAIEAVVAGRDTLAIMPTGFGKSAIYQVAGAVLGAPVVVVSPLIALQADQVAGLIGRPDAPAAVAVNSGRTDAENDESWDRLTAGEITYVFLAPEQLARDETVDRLRDAGVGLVVVDEAHCVSSWGHDFRPDYLHLGEIVERLGRPGVLALTATGSGPVRDEIVERLRLDDPLILSRGFDRPNLRLEVVRHEDDDEKIRAVVDQVADEVTPGIVYVATRRETESYTAEIAERCPDRTVVGYHGGQRSAERGELHERFHAGEVDVVVATSAFGMGIDKPDVRFVVHADVPDSLDAYYQEIGRAGRDGEPALATLHYRAEDLSLRSFFASGLPRRSELRAVFTALEAAGRPATRREVSDQLALGSRTVSRLIDLLLEAGTLAESTDGFEVVGDFDARGAAEAARSIAKTRERVEKSRIDMMRTFAEAPGCRRRRLLGYFGEDSPERCGNCDDCERAESEPGGDGVTGSADGTPDPAVFPTDARVTHAAWGEGTVMSTDGDRVTVFFESEGYKVLGVTDVVEHDLLTLV